MTGSVLEMKRDGDLTSTIGNLKKAAADAADAALRKHNWPDSAIGPWEFRFETLVRDLVKHLECKV